MIYGYLGDQGVPVRTFVESREPGAPKGHDAVRATSVYPCRKSG